MPHLESWKLIRYSSNPYRAPETWTNKLAGIVFNHPKQPDGSSVITGHLIELDTVARTAVTTGNKYTLGEPDPEWLKWLAENGYNLTDYSIKRE
jgi:hypothetical protein